MILSTLLKQKVVLSFGLDVAMMFTLSQAGIVPLKFPGTAETSLRAQRAQFFVRLESAMRRQGR